ncbi:iron-containing alcohol dehydrogenase [Chthonobacter rhizosphaerae]|uniref:iron-containing alcohol dehydrogenase n=1 Tax=Chthonobacter rhizosphaerae TaxID=2735553 RepID=UPI0015EF3F07|nr:iron-containing alcohol dehydrogenase [Chthonobacter rhizosphaerae]
MMLDRVPRMIQEAGALDRVGTLAARHAPGGAVLLVADPGLKASGITDRAIASLVGAGLRPVVFDAFKSDPTTASADAAAALARESGAGLVVALGGGSALDLGKAVACAAPGTLSCDAYALCANPLPAKPLPKICVPTTSGTGSETTRVSVLSLADGSKVWLWGDEMKADEVILDPTVTVGLPAHLTAATGIDAFVHAMEAATNVNATAANNVYAHAAIGLVTRHLLRAVEHPADLTARAGLQLAAALAGVAIDNAGTAIGHNIGHALASLRPIHHGRAVGVAVLATLAWNAAEDPDGRFAAVAAAMGETGGAAALAHAYERLLRASGVKVSLVGEGFDGITPAALAAKMAAPENAPMRRSNARTVTDDDLMVFAERVLTQA